MSSLFTRYSLVTPNRPEAACLMADRRRSPLASGTYRRESSPPSPVFDLPPMRFMAMAKVSWASDEIDPYDMAPVENRATILETGSTSSMGIGARSPVRNRNSPRSVARRSDWASTRSVYCLKTS